MKNRCFSQSIITILFVLIFLNSLHAQFPDGSIAPDFTVTDLNGNTHNLYNDLNNGYTVIIDLFATWCPPCWDYHTSNILKDAYNLHGPNGDNTLRVYGIEGDSGTDIDAMYGIGNNTEGDYVTGTPYPIINDDNIAALFNLQSWPTVLMICPSTYAHNIYNANYSTAADITAALQNPPCDGCALSTPIECDTELISTNNMNETFTQCSTTGTIISDPMRSFLLAGDGNTYTVSTCGPDTDFDTEINVYEGDCTNLTCVTGGYNDNANNCTEGIGSMASEVTFSTTDGVDYYVFVSGVSGTEGTFNLSVECECPYVDSYELIGTGIGNPFSVNVQAQPNSFITMLVNGNSYTLVIDILGYGTLTIPSALQMNLVELVEISNADCTEDLSNENPQYINFTDCTNATPVSCGSIYQDNNSGVVVDTLFDCGYGFDYPLKGYWYFMPGDGYPLTVTLDYNYTDFNAYLNVYEGDCSSLTCLGSTTTGGTINTVTGTNYYFYVSGYTTFDIGNYQVSFESEIPYNFSSTPVAVSCGDQIQSDNTGLAIESIPDCTFGGSYGFQGEWYEYIGDGDDLTISTNYPYTSFITQISVYELSCGQLTCVAEGLDMDATYTTTPGISYYIHIAGGDLGNYGTYEVSFNCGVLCPTALSLSAAPEALGVFTADDYIESASQINAGSNGPVTYQAGDLYIELKIGFEADGTVDFTAEIEDCDPGN